MKAPVIGVDQALLDADSIQRLLSEAARATFSQTKARLAGRRGEQPGHRLADSGEFAELRPHQPFDDPRHIDWRASARSHAMLTRQFHPLTGQPLCVVLDRGASMRFGSRCQLKVTAGLRLALRTLAAAQINQRQIATLLLDEAPYWQPPQNGDAAITQFLRLANRPAPPLADDTSAAHWQQAFRLIRQKLPEGAELLLLSDFHGLNQQHRSALAELAERYVLQAYRVRDPLEAPDPKDPTAPNSALSSAKLLWGEAQVDLADTQAQAGWQQALQEHDSALIQLFEQAGVRLGVLNTQDDCPDSTKSSTQSSTGWPAGTAARQVKR